jgi:hypothetical protein
LREERRREEEARRTEELEEVKGSWRLTRDMCSYVAEMRADPDMA